MSLMERMERLARDEDLGPCVVAHRIADADPAGPAEVPRGLHATLVGALASQGVDSLYRHQAAAIEVALAGGDVAIATGTASGKSLCYHLPVLDRRLRDPEATALYLFPTKALTRDQVVSMERWAEAIGGGLKIGTFDGDTRPPQRRALREDGDVVATNPYMLHSGILPNHPQWTRFFQGLRTVVLDEMHGYTGVFGSHVANVIRRLLRICAHYGSAPTFILCSATIRNPGDLARQLIGRPVDVIDDDASPKGERHVVLVNPPLVNVEMGLRRNVIDQTCRVVRHFAPHGVKTIAFAHSRTGVELLVKYLKDQYQEDGRDPARVRGYRGGYLPELRRTIEAELRDGAIDVVVSTNALELGIDIGALDLCVLAGYPRSRASFFQQAGRAGRRRSASAVVMVGRSMPLDQYVIAHPDWLLSGLPEAAAIDPDNLVIRSNQLKCAAAELPFREGDAFGPAADTGEILEYFATEARILRKAGGRYLWAARSRPADDVSLDASDIDNVVIHDLGSGRTLAEIDRPSAQTMVHEGAIYQHQGDQYLVRQLDWEGRRADLEKVQVDYYTEANTEVDVQVLTDDSSEEDGGATCVLGDVSVKKTVTMYKKIRFYTREDVGAGEVRLPSEELDTDAFMLVFDAEVATRAGLKVAGNGVALPGLGRLLRMVAPLFVRCAPSDLGVSTAIRSPFFERPTVFLFDDRPGGVGLSERLFELRGEVLRAAAEVLARCGCREGCPSCLGPGIGERAKRCASDLLAEVRVGAEIVGASG